jgi:hypothetical protein
MPAGPALAEAAATPAAHTAAEIVLRQFLRTTESPCVKLLAISYKLLAIGFQHLAMLRSAHTGFCRFSLGSCLANSLWLTANSFSFHCPAAAPAEVAGRNTGGGKLS